jgi:hypothetical protein
MHDSNDFGAPGPQPDDGRRASRHRRRPWAILAVPLTLTGLLLASQAGLASPTSGVTRASLGGHLQLAPVVPPPGHTWIQGIVTDQANQAQDDINVEAWPADPGATAPIASALTYGGPPDDPSYTHGFFSLEVPSGQPYRLVFSGVSGQEDGDLFRMMRYGHGLPIMVRNLPSASGRIRDLGLIALARQGKVTSTTKAVLSRSKVKAHKRATVRVKVTSPFVTNVTGKVVVHLAGKRVVEKLTGGDQGKVTLKLPRLKRAGTYKVRAKFDGSGTVHRSQAKPVKIKVRKHK